MGKFESLVNQVDIGVHYPEETNGDMFADTEVGDELTLQFRPAGDKWYSPTYECDAVVTSTGYDTASFDGKMWRNTSDKRLLARLIRWIRKL